MTPEAQQLAIAQHMGWRYGNLAGLECPIVPNHSSTGWFEPDGVHRDTAPPDFLNDLNAVHEAEKELGEDPADGDDSQWMKYRRWLEWVCRRDERDLIHATATQKSEALVVI